MASRATRLNPGPLGAQAMSEEIPFERVFTMTDYYDGPRTGIANFRGIPHLYESKWSDLGDDFEDSFLLTPINQDVFDAALEDWAIWLRWEEAFHRGEAPQESHPALPADRLRHEELEKQLAGQLVTNPASAIEAHGEFRPAVESTKQFGWRELEVRWRISHNGS